MSRPADTALVLPYGSRRHQTVVSALRDRVEMSRRRFGELHDKMRKREEQFAAYIPEREADAARRLQRESGLPQYTTIVVPYSYAMLLTAHTYWTSVFLGRSPVFQYADRHGAGGQNVLAVEGIIDYQVNVGRFTVPLHIWLLDMGKYSLGVLGVYWDEEEEVISRMVEQEEMLFGVLPTGRRKKVKVTERVPGYMGNKIYNVRPYHFFPDPRVPVWRFQEGEFCARLVKVGWNEIRRKELDGIYFNVGELARRASGQAQYEQSSRVMEEPGDAGSGINVSLELGGQFQELYEVYVDLIPSDWDLGSGRRPEKWVFTVDSAYRVIIGARPLGAYHNKYPFHVLEYEPEGYGLLGRSMLEVLEPLQNTLDWLFNSHMYNVRKVLNDTIIVDPSKVNLNDVKSGGPGGVWRLRPAAYGQDVRTVATQLQIQDVTAQHLSEARNIIEMMQRVVGVTDQVMGLMPQGGRRTAAEVRTATGFSVTRLRTNTEFASAMGFSTLAEMLLQNTQQYLQQPVEVRIAGDLGRAAGGQPGTIRVDPETIAGFYDYVPVDGTLPIDRTAQAALLKELIAEAAQIPQIAQEYDIGKIVAHILQLLGVKNLQQFKANVQVVPDGEVPPNVVPLGGEGDGARGTSNLVAQSAAAGASPRGNEGV